MSKSRRNLGMWGEKTAAEYLIENGYSIHGRNCRTPYGEIDIVALKSGITIFVEVKTRRNLSYGMPEEAVSAAKIEKLIQSAEAYISSHPELNVEWQIDVIAIESYKPDLVNITHFENAISDYE